ncbi:Uncharacterised protein [uncultured Ruminococcus sp.]|nr:Uncharacterised protein [uncultured Ruminococcus sp.]
MFKKKYLAVAGLMALAVVISGCGKKNSGDSVVQTTPTPTQETAVTATPTPELINMEEAVEKNVMGEKTSTASKVTIVNKTGSEVAAIYVRETPSDDSEDDEWGDDLVNGMFTLKNGENAVYYYEKGSSSVTYDIRITYSDEEKNECFFRKLPLTTMKQITLRMDGSGDDSIPYATYLTASSTKEVSTLNDVKKRLGLSTDDSDSDSSATPTPTDSSDDSSSSNSSNSDSNNANPTSTPSADNNSDPDDNDTDPTNSTIQKAESYIGMSIDDLESAVGAAQSSEYDDDDTAGTTGYYYYSDFTVSTSVDENGNEIVTGVW